MILLLVFLLVLGGAVRWTVQARVPTPPHAGPDRIVVASASPAALASLLHAFRAAVVNRDEAAATGLGADAGARQQLRHVVRNARALEIGGFEVRYLRQDGEAAPGGARTVVAEVRWQLAGYDPAPSVSKVSVRLVPEGGRIAIAGIDASGGAPAPLWLTSRLHVERSARVLVLAQDSPRAARREAVLARRALAQLEAVLPQWRGKAVVEVPATGRGLAAALGAQEPVPEGTAGVVSPAGEGRGPRTPVHIFINGAAAGSRPHHLPSAQLVLTHELVHLATRAGDEHLPYWLLEGFAEHVALRGVQPGPGTAGRIAGAVRAGGVPAGLPAAADFAPGAPGVQAAYQAAWLACRALERRLGSAGLVSLHQQVRSGRSVADALRRAGWSQEGLVRAWQAELRALVG